ncbi:leucyl/phenylalanyl-tRNA--protein transferase [Nitratifractor sp.]|uniref:leucyl/phenylalanyl-tRNA--protein transferase n=1 Tax=Nitratifractor sp. TaxID=2268144 RepID=UPI0025D5DDFD|nr:leucyl/phenylalanyl-tRNA--protein transferase [Nitratifractor sp.]
MSSIFDPDYFITPLSPYSHTFPDPRHAAEEGLLAFGGDLHPDRILKAYRHGIFPWYNPGDPILWWSPDPRLILYPDQLRVNRSFRRILRNRNYTVRFDHDFPAVITACASMPERQERGTWLTSEMQEAYTELHRRGFAHSVEVYEEEALVGGLYGIAMGRAFFGESMFSRTRDGSKIALKALSDVLRGKGYDFIDCQVVSDHLVRLGAVAVPRQQFLEELEAALSSAPELGSWSNYRWEYQDD